MPRIVIASQWQLMWWKFRKHRLAMVSLIIVLALYIVAFFAGFFAPQATASYHRTYTQAPPQTIHWFDNGRSRPMSTATSKRPIRRPTSAPMSIDENNENSAGLFRAGDPLSGWAARYPDSGHQQFALHLGISTCFGPVEAGRSVLPARR